MKDCLEIRKWGILRVFNLEIQYRKKKSKGQNGEKAIELSLLQLKVIGLFLTLNIFGGKGCFYFRPRNRARSWVGDERGL